MAPDTDRRSLRSLRSDRDDSKEWAVGIYIFGFVTCACRETTLTRGLLEADAHG